MSSPLRPSPLNIRWPEKISDFREVLLALGLFAILAIWTGKQQGLVVYGSGLGWDGTVYYDMADQLSRSLRPVQLSPFIFRPGTPFLAALLSPHDLLFGFLAANILASLIATILLVFWLRGQVRDWRVRLMLILIFLTHWAGPLRMVWFYPTLGDQWPTVFFLAALLLMESWKDPRRLALPLGLLGGLGVFFREVAWLIPLGFIFWGFQWKDPFRSILKDLWIKCVPLLLTALGWGLMRSWVVEVNYHHWSYAETALHWGTHLSPFRWVLAWLGAFGPLSAALFLRPRALSPFFQERPAQTTLLIGGMVMTYVGSGEERYFLWFEPWFLACLGIVWGSKGHVLRVPMVAGAWLFFQALSQRVFWPIPRHELEIPVIHPKVFLTPLGWNWNYQSLLAFYETPFLLWTRLAEYAALFLLLATFQYFLDRSTLKKHP